MKILFVCTGNTCRSPMAEAIFNGVSEGAFSRGIFADGSHATENAIKVMEEMNLDISEHVSTQLTREDIEEADLILTMTQSHKNMLLQIVPEEKDKIFTIGEYSNGEDIVDPYGGDIEIYRRCAETLKEEIERIVEKLK